MNRLAVAVVASMLEDDAEEQRHAEAEMRRHGVDEPEYDLSRAEREADALGKTQDRAKQFARSRLARLRSENIAGDPAQNFDADFAAVLHPPKQFRQVCAWCHPEEKGEDITHSVCKRHQVQMKIAAVKDALNRPNPSRT